MKKSLGAKTFACPSPVWCIGTYDRDGKPNLMTAAWAGICCSNPPAVSVSLRKATYSYQSILDSQAFTVNVPSNKYLKEADYAGLVSGKNNDKFKVTGLTPVSADQVNAPYVSEFPLVLECRLLRHSEIGLHTQFIGEIVDVKADETVLSESGVPDMEKIEPFLYSAINKKYYSLGAYIGDAYQQGTASKILKKIKKFVGK